MKKILLLVPVGIVAAAGLYWWLLRPPPPIPVGMVAWMAPGSVVGSTEMHAADLFLEEHPRSRLRVLPLDDEWQPDRTVPVIQEAMDQGVRFFISTHPSRCAVASLHLFADARALMINTASASPVLTGRDDYLLRIIPDVVQEQNAIARQVDQLPGHRLLVLQDEGNPAYTEPAFAAFADALDRLGQWQIAHRTLMISAFKPDDYRPLMAEDYDALYILAGTIHTPIGHIAQLFHLLHPQLPILLTPWARTPANLETAGDAIDRLILASHSGSRHTDPALDQYLRRFSTHFGYEPQTMAMGIQQAMELLDRAFAQGYDTPEAVKDYLLSVATHQTSLGPITFDRYGDVSGDFHFIRDLRQELQ